MIEIRIAGKYRLGRRIKKGRLADLFKAVDVQTGENVAVKMELGKGSKGQLAYESNILKALNQVVGVPEVYWFGPDGEFNALVFELLGPDLEKLFLYCRERFGLKTVLLVALQALARLEDLHERNFVHRDVKPENLVLGLGQKSELIHLIDYSISKKYQDSKNFPPSPKQEGRQVIGTARYASCWSLMGIEMSRRDDLESLFYVLAYFLNGSLPWQGLSGSKSEKLIKTREMKKDAIVDGLFSDLPIEMLSILIYVRSLKFEEKPDYPYIQGLLRGLLSKEKFTNDLIFDWTVRNYRMNKPLNLTLGEEIKVGESLDERNIAQDESMVEMIINLAQNK